MHLTVCSCRVTYAFQSESTLHSCQRNFLKRKKVKQESFHAYFAEVNHNGEDDWEVRLIDQTDNVEDLRKRESF